MRSSPGAADRRPGAPEVDEEEWVRFRLRLTCVRCGRIEHLEGVLENERERRGGHVVPLPLRAGRLLAQQVDGGRYGGDLTSMWLVHDEAGRDHRSASSAGGEAPAGATISAAGWTPGRQGQTVQAPTPEACLRKLARADQAREAGGWT